MRIATIPPFVAVEVQDIRRWFSNRPSCAVATGAETSAIAVEALPHAAAQPPPEPAAVPVMESSSEAAALTSRNASAHQMTAAGQRDPRIRYLP